MANVNLMTVTNGIVSNIAVFDQGADVPDGWLSVPDGVGIGYIDNGDGTYSDPTPKVAHVPTPIEIRNQELNAVTYDLGDGREIQTRHPMFGHDGANIQGSIRQLERHGVNTMTWRMADNSYSNVTKDQLQAALEYGEDEATRIWQEYIAADGG